MSKFFKNILIFSFILLVINFILSFYCNKVYLGAYKNFSLEFKSFILADSHGLPLGDYTKQYGIYNFSEGSESYFDMKRKINFLINNTSIDTLYISVDDHAFSPYREKMNNIDRSIYFSTVDDYSNIYEYLKDKITFNIIYIQPKKGMVLKRYLLSEFKKLFSSDSISNLEKDKKWSLLKQSERLKSAKSRFDQQFPSNEKSLQLEKTLKEIIFICKKNNITLIGIKFPLTKEYLGYLEDFSYGASNLFKENGLEVLDYKYLYQNNSEYFLNSDHLLSSKGKEFSKILFSKNK